MTALTITVIGNPTAARQRTARRGDPLMGREARRVPLDFDHTLQEIWPGYLMPDVAALTFSGSAS